MRTTLSNLIKLSLGLLMVVFTKSSAQQRSLDSLFEADYEQHFISSGDNFGQISLKKNNRHKFLIGLHNGYVPNELTVRLNWTDSILDAEIDLLKANGYLKQLEGKFHPTISIVMQDEGQAQFDLSDHIANEITASIVSLVPEIKSRYSNMSISKNNAYEELSFFLLSDVLLDNWQINNVEDGFLKSERPLRHGKRYYIQYAEKDPASEIEVFGIYGNQYMCSDAICYITYGNNRKNHFKKMEELDLMNIPLLTKQDQAILDEMADLFRPQLIEILNKNRDVFQSNYKNSIYSNEIIFEEYFIWYYHFLYTSVTNKLNDKGHLSVPESGIYRVRLEK